MNENAVFNYTYSAKENKEIQAIRDKYLPKEENEIDRIRKLDGYIKSAGVTQSIIIGIIGVLIFGIGMCLGLDVLRGGMLFAIVLGVVGSIVMITAYPIYKKCSARAKDKYVPEILRIAQQIEDRR